MHRLLREELAAAPASSRWSGSRARAVGQLLNPRRHLRVLPSRTRPSLYAGD